MTKAASSDLVRYDAACKALAVAKSTDDVKTIRDHAEAMRAYARQAKNKQLEIDAAEIRIRAERRLGELITEQKRTVGLNKGGNGPGRGNKKPVPTGNRLLLPTLDDAGIDKKLSMRAQRLAQVPAKIFERRVSTWRDEMKQRKDRVSLAALRDETPSPRPRARRARQRGVSQEAFFSPVTTCLFDVDARMRQTIFDLDADDRAELLECVRQLLVNIERELKDAARVTA